MTHTNIPVPLFCQIVRFDKSSLDELLLCSTMLSDGLPIAIT